jgi:pSer/pThr/pTyr-binding forkhead associated (FHA) protein
MERSAMRDGETRRLKQVGKASGLEKFLSRFEAKLMVIDGPAAGAEYALESLPTVIGRGPGVNITVNDSAASRQHAAVGFQDDGFRVSDLGSTNGLTVNDEPTEECSIESGDCFAIGDHRFQLVIVEREDEPEAYSLTIDA